MIYWLLPYPANVHHWQAAGLESVCAQPTIGDCPPGCHPPGVWGAATLFSLGGPPPRGTPLHWQRVAGSDWWCGYDVPPRPRDLDRGVPLVGWPVRLGDGQEWVIPIVQPFRAGDPQRIAGLPCEPQRDNQQRVRPVVLERYRALVDDLQQIAGEGSPPAAGGGYLDFLLATAVRLIGVGYRVTWHEVCALDLLPGAEYVTRVLAAALDAPEAQRLAAGAA